MLNELNDIVQHFHFIRPLWLLGLVLVVVLVLWLKKSSNSVSQWNHVVDPQLQAHVLITPEQQHTSSSNWWMPLALSLIILSLAGPTWQKIPQTAFKTQTALVVILDLSRSMDAADIPPSRLLRAKLKIIDLLNKRKEGQTALIAYAAEAFTVSPLTEDNETIVSLMKTMNTQMMPSQGSRLDKALMKANDLMQQANIPEGYVVVFSDGLSAKEQRLIKTLGQSKHKISVIAVGTDQGAPIAMNGQGYLKDKQGQIVVAKMQSQALQNLAQQASGVFATLRSNDDDLDALLEWMKPDTNKQHSQKIDRKFDIWYEQGPWLLWLVLPLVLMGFRRGFLVAVAVMLLPSLQPAHAIDWQSWFKNSDQQGLEHYQQGEYEQAQKSFQRKDWKAAAEFQNKDYESAMNAYDLLQGNDALYNKGNALAKMQRFEEAIKAWDEVLKNDPNNEDALYNKKQVEDFLKQQSNKQQNKDQQQQQDNKNKEQQQQNDQQQKQQQKKQDSQQQSKQQQGEKGEQEKKQQASEQQNSEQKQADQHQKQQAKEKQQQKKQNQAKDVEKDKSEKEKAEQAQQKLAQQQAQKEQEKQRKQAEQQAFNEAQKLKQEPLDEQTKQWLRRIPDDPGGLLRNKFRYQYQQLQRHSDEQHPW